MSEMVERVARAMWAAREQTLPAHTRVPFDERLTGDIWVMARAAIAAMREPTEGMVDVVAGQFPEMGIDHRAAVSKHFTQMIDEALR